MFAMGSARRSPGAGGARVWAPLEAEPGPLEDGSPVPERTEARSPRGRSQALWNFPEWPVGRRPVPAGGPADSHGGAARNVMGE